MKAVLVVAVCVVAVLLGWPQPSIDVQSEYKQLAHEFAGTPPTSNEPLKGTVVVITGATSGIGKSLAVTLGGMGATIVALGRSGTKLAQLQKDTGSVDVVPMVADFSDLTSISKAADEILHRFERVDILVNNAGMHYFRAGASSFPTTSQGHDLLFGVNYLSHFLLTEKLLPALEKSRLKTIVQMSSSFHWAVDGSDLRVVNDTPPVASLPRGSSLLFRDQRTYANSKLAQLLHSRSLARAGTTQARIVSVCPAWVATNIGGDDNSFAHTVMGYLAFPSDGWGLASTLRAMFDDEDGDFYINSRVFQLFDLAFPNFVFQPWSTSSRLRDVVCYFVAPTLLFFQKFAPAAFPSVSSPESYDVDLQDSLYKWSKAAVAEWL